MAVTFELSALCFCVPVYYTAIYGIYLALYWTRASVCLRGTEKVLQ